MKRWTVVAVALSIWMIRLDAAFIVMTVERTTLPEDEWQQLVVLYSGERHPFAGLSEDDGFRIDIVENKILFTYTFEGGYDYLIYNAWKSGFVNLNNDNHGMRWTISADGEISEESNPWKASSWLQDARVYDGDYIASDSIGWFWSETWDPQGQFWAYSFSVPEWDWVYFLGGGFYYANELYYYNWPGSEWFFEYNEVDGQFGSWRNLIGNSIPQIESLNEAMIDEVIRQNLPGLAVGVFENGEVIHLGGYGLTDLNDPDSKVSFSTVFEWASISKTITAIAALQMDEADNDFNLSDRVLDHVPYWDDSETSDEARVTIEHLITNRSGIHHYGSGNGDDSYTFNKANYDVVDPDGWDAQKSVSVFKGTGIDFWPGDEFLYSSFGFNLLGAAVEEASPDGYIAWVQENIFDPVRASSVQVARNDRLGYRRRCDGALTPYSTDSYEWVLPGGGWESNVADLTRIIMAMTEGEFLDDTSRLWARPPGNSIYAHGTYVEGTLRGPRVFHGGVHNNARTLFSTFPEERFGMVILTMAEHADRERLRNRIEMHFGYVRGYTFPTVDRCRPNVMGDCTGKFTGVWRQTGDDVIIRRGYSHVAFFNEWEFLRENGYYCDDFEPHVIDGKVQWDGVFRKGGGGNGIWRGQNFAEFKTRYDEQTALGYHLVDIETYVLNGTRRWAGLFRPGTGKHQMVRGLTTAGFGARRDDLASQGYKLIDIEAYEQDGQLLWAGTFVEGQDGLLNRNYSAVEFYDLWEERSANGWRLLDVEAYRVNGELRWAGIWEQDDQVEAFYTQRDYCNFMDLHADHSSEGYELIDMEYDDY